MIGEEGADRSGARTWFVDPVDGTYNFLSGLPVWCSALALVDDEGPVLGAVYAPVTDELWLGGRSSPLTRNGVALPPLTERPLAEISIAAYLHPGRMDDAEYRATFLRVARGAATVRMLGSGSVELAAVASGRLGLWLQADSALWDWYPGAALVRAAGGVTREVQQGGHLWRLAGDRRSVEEAAALIGHR